MSWSRLLKLHRKSYRRLTIAYLDSLFDYKHANFSCFRNRSLLYQRKPRDFMTRSTDHITAVNSQFRWPIEGD